MPSFKFWILTLLALPVAHAAPPPRPIDVPLTSRTFQAASRQGAGACAALAKSPYQYKLCLMYAAYQRKNVRDCDPLKKYENGARRLRHEEVRHFKCVGMVATLTKNKGLCAKEALPIDRKICQKYAANRESTMAVWGIRYWESAKRK